MPVLGGHEKPDHYFCNKSRETQRAHSMKSTYRLSRDLGQRYVVRYRDGMGTARNFGFTNDAEQAATWLLTVAEKWRGGEIVDRQMKLPLRP